MEDVRWSIERLSLSALGDSLKFLINRSYIYDTAAPTQLPDILVTMN